jgi:hypothetical protein
MEHVESAGVGHDDHEQAGGDEHHETHAEARASYTFECRRISELDVIEARFLDIFDATEAVRTTVITQSTSSYVELKRGNNAIPVDGK